MKKISLILSAAMVTSMLAAVPAAAEEEKAISYGMGYDASTMDPGMSNDDATITPIRLMTESLLRTQPDGSIGGGMAESWEVSEDGKVWTFKLRETTFSDGTPITAETIKYSLARLVNPENALDNMSSLADLKSAEAYMNGEASAEDLGIAVLDDYTLELTFDYPQYEKSFTSYVYAPVNQALVESAGEAFGSDAEYFLGNGPFMLEDWVHDAEIVMVKNPNYWNADAIKLDKITQVAGATADTAVDMMATDTLDAASFTTMMYMESALEIPGMTSMEETASTQSIHLNCEGKTDETGVWLSNVNFRQALSHAIDRTAMVAAVYTTDTPAAAVIPESELAADGTPFNEHYSYTGLNVTAEPEAAQEYLAKAMEEIGVSDASEIPTFTMLAFDSEGNVKCLNAIADQWNKTLGINCEVDMEPIMEMIGKALSKDYDFWKGGNGITLDFVDFFTSYDSIAGEGAGVNYVNDEEYHTLYQTAREASTWEARKDAEAALAQYWTDNMMDIMITWQTTYIVYKDSITGVLPGQLYADFTYADIAE